MKISHEQTNKWDVFDVLMAHEDGYTNLLKYLFEHSKEFKNKLSNRIFNKTLPNLAFCYKNRVF